LVTAFYFPIPAQFGAVLTKLLQGKIRPFVVKRNFNEIIGYVTDRKAGPTVDGNVTYLGQYAGRPSYGLITVQVPQHHPAGSPIDASAIKKVESIPYPAFLKFLQDQTTKRLSARLSRAATVVQQSERPKAEIGSRNISSSQRR